MTTLAVPYKVIVLGFALVCLVLTAFLLIWPGIFKAANRLYKKWISTDALEKKLNQTHDIDKNCWVCAKLWASSCCCLP